MQSELLLLICGLFRTNPQGNKLRLFVQCKHSVKQTKLYKKDIIVTYLEAQALWEKLKTYKFAQAEEINMQKMDWMLVVATNRQIEEQAVKRTSKAKTTKIKAKKTKKEPSVWKKQILAKFDELSPEQKNEIYNNCINYDASNIQHLLTAFTAHLCKKSEFSDKLNKELNNNNEENEDEDDE